MSEWYPIETAPMDGTSVLGFIPENDKHFRAITVVSYTKHNHIPIYGWVYLSRLDGEELEGCNPTHWMPLPEPPK